MRVHDLALLCVATVSVGLAVASCSGAEVTTLDDGGPNGDANVPNPDANADGNGDPCPGKTSCGAACVDLQSDNANCGMCGKACAQQDQCSAGACVSCTQVDKDKDGYNACTDCDDTDPLVNPGAFDVPGNAKDDDCNMKVDDVPACDTGLASDSKDPLDMAKAMDICDPNATAAWTTLADDRAHQVAPDWGLFVPQAGAAFAALSNGIAADVNDTKPLYTVDTPQPGTDLLKTNVPFPVLQVQSTVCNNVAHTDPATVQDLTNLTVTLKVPTNAKSFALDTNYLTAEFPEYVCSATFDDPAFVLLESGAFQGNIAIGGASGRALSVASGLLTHTTAMQLQGTGMDKVTNNGLAGGATGWRTLEAPVVPGETIKLHFVVLDAIDGVFDTQLLLDHFRWQTRPLCGPVAQPVPVDGGVPDGGGAPACPDGGIADASGQ